ncbi:MAG: GNAT family N-acetyltransferase [Candidatus Acidiferrum sp.]
MRSDKKTFRQPDSECIRFASVDDLGGLTKLINAAFVVERPFLDGERIDDQGTREFFDKGKFLIVEEAPGIVGCVYCEVRDERGYLGLLAVDPLRQGTGLGRKLMAAAEKYFRDSGCQAVDLRIISPRVPLPLFYRHLGYVEIGTAPFSPSMPIKVPGHYILMSKHLL